ncbi:MAG: hypothetical protein QNL01_01570 [Akkermansiaceae bacterium]|jgi:hypothetical protein|tara:strand:- start:51427 stop:51819 length:393 start_codon:yes stop_codon:yes gene_type:complete
MNYETYRLIHFAGIFTLFFAFGSLFAGKSSTKGAAIGHGIGLLLILLGGFGMQAKMKDVYTALYGTGFPTWMILKLVIWIIFGGAMVLAKRRIVQGVAAWILIIVLGLASAYLAFNKPALGNKPAAAASE